MLKWISLGGFIRHIFVPDRNKEFEFSRFFHFIIYVLNDTPELIMFVVGGGIVDHQSFKISYSMNICCFVQPPP